MNATEKQVQFADHRLQGDVLGSWIFCLLVVHECLVKLDHNGTEVTFEGSRWFRSLL